MSDATRGPGGAARRLLLLALALTGCSVVVEGYEPPTCATNADCAILNELDGIGEGACERWQCDVETDRCAVGVRDGDRDGLIAPECASAAPGREVDCDDTRAGGQERCNGVDDDCDGVVDEQFTVDGEVRSPLPATAPQPLFSVGPGSPSRVGHGGGGGELAVAHVTGSAATFSIASGADALDAAPMSYQRAADLGSLTSSALTEGCHGLSPTGDVVPGSCSFEDTDVALSAESVFVATVSTSGCGAGQLRVGYADRAARPAAVIGRGPARRSNVFTGVDVDPAVTDSLACTGARRGSGVLGAARPSIAAIDLTGAADQALAVWIADRVDRASCGGDARDVELLGLRVQLHTFGDTYGWVTGSDEGAPQVVGQTTGGGRPGVAAWEQNGYLVAWGEDDGIGLAFVAPMDAPPAFDASGAPDDRTGLETGPLRVTALGRIPTSGAADDVVLAPGSLRAGPPGRPSEGGVELGVAWRQGCGGGEESIFFRQLFVVRDGDALSLDLDRSFDSVTLAEAPAASPPTIAYAFGGLLADGVARADGRPTGAPGNDGGWYVAWADAPAVGMAGDGVLRVQRISEADGLPLSGAPAVIATGQDEQRAAPALYSTTDERIAYAFFTPDPEMAVHRGGLLTCLAE